MKIYLNLTGNSHFQSNSSLLVSFVMFHRFCLIQIFHLKNDFIKLCKAATYNLHSNGGTLETIIHVSGNPLLLSVPIYLSIYLHTCTHAHIDTHSAVIMIINICMKIYLNPTGKIHITNYWKVYILYDALVSFSILFLHL